MLCGELRVELDGRRIDGDVAGRQGRLLLAYLIANRGHQVDRDDLLELLWPGRQPPDPDAALRTQLSKLRRAVAPGVLEGRAALVMRLPEGTTIDLEDAVAGLERGQRALAESDLAVAGEAAAAVVETASRGFCLGLEGPWVDARRDEVSELWLRALECRAEASLGLEGPELGAAIDAAREIIDAAPLRETGQRLLMTALARRGSVPEALGVYEELRVLLRAELGTSPSRPLVELHEQLVRTGPPAPSPDAEWLVVSPGSPREWVVKLEDMLLVGRDCGRVDPSRRVVLDDPKVSREHLELRRNSDNAAVLVDLSTNGTSVNGRRLERGDETPLADRDLIELGDEKLLFRAPGADDPSADRSRTTLRS